MASRQGEGAHAVALAAAVSRAHLLGRTTIMALVTQMTISDPAYLRPGGIERLFGRILAALVKIGLIRGHFYVLEVRGRKSGRTVSLPVDTLELNGRRYLVCARGNSNWVRNARSSGEVVLARAMRRQRYSVRELPPSARPPILKGYLDAYAREVQRFFPVPKGSDVERFNELALRYPVFELEPLAGPQGARLNSSDS